jgi:phenylacetic acid degradation operon negative regulatory protein
MADPTVSAKSTTHFAQLTRALASRFRRQRPLRAGSLLVTILGDAIVPRGGVIALASLIELARPFGLTERLVRTSIGRLANEDWVASQRSGRLSYYSLTATGAARFAEATERIYAAPSEAWSGEWTLAILAPGKKAARDAVRRELSWLGFGEITPGVFAHPTHPRDGVLERVGELASGGAVIVMQRAAAIQGADAQLAALGWDFDDLARRYRRFISTFEPVHAAADGADVDGETAFVLRTLLLHEYRKVHLRDPLLPARLLPQPWIGADAHELCRSLYSHVCAASERHLSARAQALTGSLPSAGPAIFRRFGGLGRDASRAERRG